MKSILNQREPFVTLSFKLLCLGLNRRSGTNGSDPQFRELSSDFSRLRVVFYPMKHVFLLYGFKKTLF